MNKVINKKIHSFYLVSVKLKASITWINFVQRSYLAGGNRKAHTNNQHIVLFLYYQTNISKLRGAIFSSPLIVNKPYTSKLKSEWLPLGLRVGWDGTKKIAKNGCAQYFDIFSWMAWPFELEDVSFDREQPRLQARLI